MKTHRFFVVFVIGLTTINATPTPKLTPKSAESKKTLIAEATKIDNTEKPKIDVENAEESKNADRTKKSASTTFCVEIRPGATDGPQKVCDSPVPHQDHEVHENPPVYDAEPEVPLVVIPQTPVAVYDSCLQPDHPPSISCIQPQPPPITYIQPQIPPYIAYQNPCPPPPCPPNPCGTWGVHRPHGQVTLYRSSNGSPMEDLVPSSFPDSKMEMKSIENDGKISAMESGMSASSEIQSMPFGPETVGTLFEKSHKKPSVGLYPIYPSSPSGCQQTSHFIVPQYQQASRSCGSMVIVATGRQSEERPEEAVSMTNADGLGPMTMGQQLMNMDIGQARTYSHYPTMVQQPMIGVLPTGGFSSNPTIYQPSAGYQTYQRRYDPYNPPSMIAMPSGGRLMYRTDMGQSGQHNDEKPRNIQSEQKKTQVSNSMSPSKMLNQMRGHEFQKTSTMMQSFPRENEDHQMEKGTQINVHIPFSVPAYMTGSGAKNSEEDKISDILRHEEIGKKVAESPSNDSMEA